MGTSTPYNIFMLAYGEPNAAENWARLQSLVPRHFPAPQLIEGVAGLHAAHLACARRATTPWFFVVDGDNWIHDGFAFEVPFEPMDDEVAVWAATNQFNRLYYGHGGIKLFPKALLDENKPTGLDLPLSAGQRTRFVDVKASEHRFNTSPYATWAAVFRECVKLGLVLGRRGLKARSIARYRLDHWTKIEHAAPFAQWCAQGAADGIAYAQEFHGKPDKLERINDYAWLREAFARRDAVLRRKAGVPAATTHDVFMIAYGEKNAAANWARLRQLAPQARLIENVQGIVAGYAACAAAATTEHFFAVDADNWVLDDFRFEVPFAPEVDETVFWYAKNPVNGLVYGHGAIKLFPSALLKDQAASLTGRADFSTEVGRTRYTETCASEHRFNADPFSSWCGAFRECAKLAISTVRGTPETVPLAKMRLDAWCTRRRNGAAFGDWCLKGAAEGKEFGLAQVEDVTGVNRINDYAWLRDTFRARHVRKVKVSAKD